MKRALVCGAGGFIGNHLVRRLVHEGFWVRGVDIKKPEFDRSIADEFQILDLRDIGACNVACTLTAFDTFDHVYQLAADMGGMGFIQSHSSELVRNNTLINLNMLDAATKRMRAETGRYFFSSSACVYPNQMLGQQCIDEEGAYPAHPDNEYGWEKLYAERMILDRAKEGLFQPRIARFQNCYGQLGTWRGGREKAPAALCRKMIEAGPGGEIEIWGDGTAQRTFIYVDDLVDGIRMLMDSGISEPTNIGVMDTFSVNDLVTVIETIAGYSVKRKYVPGPVGVQARNHSNERILSTGWIPRWTLVQGLGVTYRWIEYQVKRASQYP